MRNVSAIPAMEHSAALEMQTTHNPGSAVQRPRSVAQKAGMNVWSRHAARYGSAPMSRTACLLSQCSHEPLLCSSASCKVQRPPWRSCGVTCLPCCRCSLTSNAHLFGKLMLLCCVMDEKLRAAAAAGRLGGPSRAVCPAGAAPSARRLAPVRPARRTPPRPAPARARWRRAWPLQPPSAPRPLPMVRPSALRRMRGSLMYTRLVILRLPGMLVRGMMRSTYQIWHFSSQYRCDAYHAARSGATAICRPEVTGMLRMPKIRLVQLQKAASCGTCC